MKIEYKIDFEVYTYNQEKLHEAFKNDNNLFKFKVNGEEFPMAGNYFKGLILETDISDNTFKISDLIDDAIEKLSDTEGLVLNSIKIHPNFKIISL